MYFRKLLALAITLNCSPYSLSANPAKDINKFIKTHLENTLGEYAWFGAASLITAGTIYALYTTHTLNTHKKRFSHHELLQDHYENMLTLTNSYDPYTGTTNSLCKHLSHKSPQQLSALHSQATRDLNQLKKSHKETLMTFTAIKDIPHLNPLYQQKDLFIELYNKTLPVLRCLTEQIPYVQAQNFLDNYEYTQQEITLNNTNNFMNDLNDIVHSRNHGLKKYPYRSYTQWLSTIRPTVSRLINNLQDIQQQPFQEHILPTLAELNKALDLINTRIKGSNLYKKECHLYNKECQQKALEAARQREVQRQLRLQQEKLQELKKQTNIMEQKERRDLETELAHQAYQPPTTQGTAPTLDELNSNYHTSQPEYNTDTTDPSAPTLEELKKA